MSYYKTRSETLFSPLVAYVCFCDLVIRWYLSALEGTKYVKVISSGTM